MTQSTRFGRRNLLKSGAVLGAGAAAAMGLVPGSGSQAAEAQSAIPETWDMETDVVVVGSGGTGLIAAVEAGDAGAEVIVVEKGDHVGGLWIGAGGHAIFGATHVHERLGIEDHLEWWYEDEMGQCDYRGVPEIIRTFVEEGPDTALWLEERVGIVWSDAIQTFNPGHRVPRGLWPAPSENYPDAGGWPQFAGNAWITMLKKALAENGGQLLLKHRLTRIFRDGDGPVVGIEVDNEGTLKTIKARRGVVLAAGGYTDNSALVGSWDPRMADLYPDGAGPNGVHYVRNTGDALKAATEIGASLTDMSFVSFCAPKWGTKVYWLWDPSNWDKTPDYRPGGVGFTLSGQGFQRVILVRGNGKRYINEALGAEENVAEHPGEGVRVHLPKPA